MLDGPIKLPARIYPRVFLSRNFTLFASAFRFLLPPFIHPPSFSTKRILSVVALRSLPLPSSNAFFASTLLAQTHNGGFSGT